jgi:hypothetical protein
VTATRVCVLRSGGEYGPAHVRWLAKQVPGLVALSDVPIRGVPVVPLQTDYPGWWAKMELFSNSIPGDLLYFDLDTVIVGDVARLEVGRTTVMRDVYKPRQMQSSLMYIAQADKRAPWREFTREPKFHMRRCTTRFRWGDQGFLQDFLRADRWQDVLPGAVISYKRDVRKTRTPPGSDAVAVVFHGRPRPWDTREPWVPRLLNRTKSGSVNLQPSD